MGMRVDLKQAMQAAVQAARAAGALMRRNLRATKRANFTTQHDIKLELDVLSQKLIERVLRDAFPQISLLGEEGVAGRADAQYRWVVDPIDGTGNFPHRLPPSLLSIAPPHRTRPRHANPPHTRY